MELEQVKAAWQREKAAYPCRDPKAIVAETMQKAMKMDRDFNRRQRTQILCSLLCLGLMAARYRPEGPLLANAGLIVMLLCLALMTAGSIILKYHLRESHPELPRQKYLTEERKKIAAQIALLRRNVRWLFIPAMLGLLTWQMGPSPSVQRIVALAIIAAVVSTGTVWFYRWKLRKDLLPILEDIDSELECFRK